MKYKLEAKNIDVFYGELKALNNINIGIMENAVTALIGPSGCGKSTFLRLFNRMNDYIDSFKLNGEIFIDNKNIYDKSILVDELRKNVGMVFQKPNPFPKSIFENVAYGLKIQGIKDKEFIKTRVKDALQQAALWDEVKDDLNKSALALSGGQQQRVCIARALAVEPSIILMDEPASGLINAEIDEIDNTLRMLSKEMNIAVLIVEHRIELLETIADRVVVMDAGEIIAEGNLEEVINNPKVKEAYFEG